MRSNVSPNSRFFRCIKHCGIRLPSALRATLLLLMMTIAETMTAATATTATRAVTRGGRREAEDVGEADKKQKNEKGASETAESHQPEARADAGGGCRLPALASLRYLDFLPRRVRRLHDAQRSALGRLVPGTRASAPVGHAIPGAPEADDAHVARHDARPHRAASVDACTRRAPAASTYFGAADASGHATRDTPVWTPSGPCPRHRVSDARGSRSGPGAFSDCVGREMQEPHRTRVSRAAGAGGGRGRWARV